MRTPETLEKPLETTQLLKIIDRMDESGDPVGGVHLWPNKSQLKRAVDSLQGFRRTTRWAFWVYLGFLAMLLASFLSEPNGFSASMTLLGFLGFLGLLLLSFFNHSDFYHAVGRFRGGESPLVIFFLGMPLYYLFYLHLERHMRTELTGVLHEMGLTPEA